MADGKDGCRNGGRRLETATGYSVCVLVWLLHHISFLKLPTNVAKCNGHVKKNVSEPTRYRWKSMLE